MDTIGGKSFRVETKQTSNNKVFTKFTVGESKRIDGKYIPEYFECIMWGTHPTLADGQQVICYGHKGTREYNEKTYLTFDVFHIQVLTQTEKFSSPQPRPQMDPVFSTAQTFEDVPF